MLTVSTGAVLGSLVLVKIIPYVRRKSMLTWSFLVLAVLLAATGGSFLGTFQKESYILTVVLYALCQFAFNLGPNSLTFIIPAEIFPTRYRCTCHGLSAAAGKLGSIVVQAILPSVVIGGKKISDPDSDGLGYVLIIFSVVMASGSIFAWAWIPDVQGERGEGNKRDVILSKGLEELAEGRRVAEELRQVIGLRRRVVGLFRRG
jgi:MFS transporter, PHS family, inorganic phosphate transporter